MSRKVDIWALGCVFSEHLTWAIRGPGAVKKYEERRLEENLFAGDTRGKGKWREDCFFVKYAKSQRLTKLMDKLAGVEETWTPGRQVPQLKVSVSQVRDCAPVAYDSGRA
jgi:hypothetical protein